MKIFITAPFRQGKNREEIEYLCGLVKKSGFEDFCFVRDVENYQGNFNDPQELMERAKKEIESCDALLIDLTKKSTGRAIEAGMAYAMGKKIIIIAKKGTLLKDTARGISDLVVEYDSLDDIVPFLKKIIK